MEILVVLIIVFLVAGLTELVHETAHWSVHKEMSDSHMKPHFIRVKASFKEVVEEFNKYVDKMDYDVGFPDSIFGKGIYYNTIYIHADIIQIGNILFYMKTPFDLIKFTKFKKKFIKDHFQGPPKKISYKKYKKLQAETL